MHKGKGLSSRAKKPSRISVRVKPNARTDRVIAYSSEREVLDVALNAPPREGEANAALIDVLSEFFGVTKRQIKIVSGLQSREKIVEVEGDSNLIVECLMKLSPSTISADANRTVRYTKSNLPSKICASCERPFNWRKKWENCWDEVLYCSDRCRKLRA